MQTDQDEGATPILAAGGILAGEGENEGKIALVRRRRYDGEIGLPKGKVKKHEDLLSAATREVKEETGYGCEIVGFAGSTHYQVKMRPKAVMYFMMKITGDSPPAPVDGEEIDGVEWMTPSDAVTSLTHHQDRDLVTTVFRLPRAK
jgi:8-oxo-dGTP pyrophosphatase MutT (NUDIX family)